jgi:hypothetical protein
VSESKIKQKNSDAEVTGEPSLETGAELSMSLRKTAY